MESFEMIEFDGTSDSVPLSSYRPGNSFSVFIWMGSVHVIEIGGGK